MLGWIDGGRLEDIKRTLTVTHRHGAYRDLLAPGLVTALLVGVWLAILQQFCGANNVTTYIQVIKLGRRKLMLIGTALMGGILFALAWAFALIARKEAALQDVTSIGRMVFVLVLAYIATFAFTLGPVTWVPLSEIYPNFIREKALSIASCALWTACFLVVLVTPTLLSLSPVFNFVLFGVMNVIGFFSVLKWLPETKGLSLERLDDLWSKR